MQAPLTLFLLLFCLQLHAGPHPGGMHPKAQIDFVRNQIIKGKQPYLNAYKQLIGKANKSLAETDHAVANLNIPGYYRSPEAHRKNALSIQGDAFSAYACALAWQLSGRKVYAEKAIYFLNAWSSLNTMYSSFDGSLVMTYAGTALVMAAELMTNYKFWKAEDRDAFRNWTVNVYRKAANEIRSIRNNWGDWGRFGSILADTYLDDTVDLSENIRLIKSGLIEKIAADGHLPEEAARGENGLWYTYFSLSPLTAACWTIYNTTGENLFAWEYQGRSIKKAVDYLLYFNQHPREWSWYKNPVVAQSDASTGFWPPNLIEAMYGVYGDEKYKKFAAPYQPVIHELHHFAWTFPTLMPLSLKGYNAR